MHGILGKNRRETIFNGGAGPRGSHSWKLSLGVLHGLEKEMYARDDSKRVGSEARGKDREG